MPEEWYDRLWKFKEPGEIRQFLVEWLYPGKLRPKTIWNPRDGQETTIPGVYPNLPKLRAHKYEGARYHGLNIHSWMQRSTIEWRQSQGSLERERLIFWSLFCGWFVEICGRLRDSEAQRILSLEDLIYGEWKSPIGLLSLPEDLRDWVETI